MFCSQESFRNTTYQYISKYISIYCSGQNTTNFLFSEKGNFSWEHFEFFGFLPRSLNKLLIFMTVWNVLLLNCYYMKNSVHKLVVTIMISSSRFTLFPEKLSFFLLLHIGQRRLTVAKKIDNISLSDNNPLRTSMKL